jgi:hypothetical protein
MDRFRYSFTPLAAVLAVFALLEAGDAIGQPIPKIVSFSPKWIQRGITNQVVIEGENLAPVIRLIFRDEKEVSASIYAAPPTLRLETSQPGVLAVLPP